MKIPPHGGDPYTGLVVADTPTALLMQHIQSTPPPPSSRTELIIPQLLDRIVLSCLAKDPAQRPQSAKELSRRLAEIDIESAWTEERRSEWWQKHKPVARAAIS